MKVKQKNFSRNIRLAITLFLTILMIGPILNNVVINARAEQDYVVGQGWLSDEGLHYTYSARRLARAPNGHLFVAYSVKVNGYEQIYLKKSTDHGLTWNNGEPVFQENKNQYTPALLVDSYNRIIVIWINSDGFLLYRSKIGSNWEQTTPYQVANQVSPGYIASALGPSDSVHVLYSSDWTGCRYRMRSLTGWGNEMVVESGPYRRARDIVVKNNGEVHAFFDDTHTPYFVLKHGRKIGSSWSNTFIGQSNNEIGSHPSATITDDDAIHVVWNYLTGSNYHICYRKYASSGWEANTQYVTGPTSYIQVEPVISTDSSNRLWIVWLGESEEYPSVHIRTVGYITSDPWGDWTHWSDWCPIGADFQNAISLWGNFPQINGVKVNRWDQGYAMVVNYGAWIIFNETWPSLYYPRFYIVRDNDESFTFVN